MKHGGGDGKQGRRSRHGVVLYQDKDRVVLDTSAPRSLTYSFAEWDQQRRELELLTCQVCGALPVLAQSPGAGFTAYKQTCGCWFCSGCLRSGRENDPRCDCVPCSVCKKPYPPGVAHICDGVPL